MNAPQKSVVDMKIPLPWLLTAGGAIIFTMATTLWSVAGQSNKLDQLLITTVKLEKRLDDRDEKSEALRDRMSNFDRTADNLKLRVDALERLKK